MNFGAWGGGGGGGGAGGSNQSTKDFIPAVINDPTANASPIPVKSKAFSAASVAPRPANPSAAEKPISETAEEAASVRLLTASLAKPSPAVVPSSIPALVSCSNSEFASAAVSSVISPAPESSAER